MFTQVETRLAVEKIAQRVQADHHARHASAGTTGRACSCLLFDDPTIQRPPDLAQGLRAWATPWPQRWSRRQDGDRVPRHYDLWAPARQYMVYHGQPRTRPRSRASSSRIHSSTPRAETSPSDRRTRAGIIRFRQGGNGACDGLTTTPSPRRSVSQSRRKEPRHLARNFYRCTPTRSIEGRRLRLCSAGIPGDPLKPPVARHPARRRSRDPPVPSAVRASRHRYGLGSWVINGAALRRFPKRCSNDSRYPDLRLFPWPTQAAVT